MTTVVDAPQRADGLQLCGTMEGSGYRSPPALVRRGDGQTLQLTPLLYLVLEALDGRRTHAEIADVVSSTMKRGVPADVVTTLIDEHLRPLGLVTLSDGTQPPVRKSDPLLGLKLKLAVTDARSTRRITDPFRVLFRPGVVLPVMVAFVAVTWWVFFRHGLAPAAYDAFQRPHLLLLVFVVTVLSGGFHEFGHAAAARYGGAVPGAMGAGIYLVWPAFYTDVTDSYRLDRRGRIRTDLGGLYFNAMVVVLTFGWWYSTGWDALLLLVATQTFQMVQQLLPLMRFDGYHLLADLAGVPDLYHRIGPTLRGLLPHRWSDPENRVLKPSARAVITAWVLVTIPMMALMLLAVVAAVPRLLGTAWAVVSEDAAGMMAAWRDGGLIDITAHALQVLGVALSLLGCLLILGRVGIRWSRGLAGWSRGSFARRVIAMLVSTAVVTTLSWAWWPHPDTYRPITPDETGSLSALLMDAEAAPGLASPAAGVLAGDVLPAGAAAESRLGTDAPLQATFPAGHPLPTEASPELTIVLVPTQDPEEPEDPAAAPEGSTEPWVFPFSEPLPPGAGDNQAAAYNTTDGSVTYDVAFALVWATDDQVLNVNEAHAYASCSDCVTVAVAFQVVLIVDDAQVIAPQNLAVAANYECYACITAALASQLVLTLPGMPTGEQMLALTDVWEQLDEVADNIESFTLEQIALQLAEVQAQIIATLGVAAGQPGESPPPSSTVAPTTSPTSSPSGSSSPTPSPSSPSPTPDSSSATPTPTSPTGTPPASSAPTPTASPSPSAETSSTSPSPSP